jgi:hypothetical protein
MTTTTVKLIYEPAVRLLTGNGPQTIDAQARKIRSILSTRPRLYPPTTADQQKTVVTAGN